MFDLINLDLLVDLMNEGQLLKDQEQKMQDLALYVVMLMILLYYYFQQLIELMV
jgi:hypothetical protein